VSQPIRATDVEPENVDWLWPNPKPEDGRIPRGMLVFVAGRPDQGKGLFVVRVAADVSNGTATGRPERVLYSAIEDSQGLMTRPRLEAAGANLDNVFLWKCRIPERLKELEAHVIRRQISLVVFDPVAAHLSHGISRHSDNIRSVLNPLAEIAENTGVTFLFVDHALKRVRQGGHPLDAVGGSGSGLPAACRMGYVFGQDPNDADMRYLCNVKSNLREKPSEVQFEIDVVDTELVANVPSVLVLDTDVTFDPMRLFDNKKRDGNSGRGDRRAAAAEWLTNYLLKNGKTHSKTVIEDAKQMGLTTKTLRRAASDMGVVITFGRGATWDLPQDVKDALAPTTPAPQPKDGVTEEQLEEAGADTVSEEELAKLAAEAEAAGELPDWDEELVALLGNQPDALSGDEAEVDETTFDTENEAGDDGS
jgi:hypothetical protein